MPTDEPVRGDEHLLHGKLTREILQACFQVINELGSGFLESVYERALVIALRDKGMDARSQVSLEVMFRGEPVGHFFADILVEEMVIVELKAVSTLLPEHKAQVLNYLRATDCEIALLVNFGKPKLEYRRFQKSHPAHPLHPLHPCEFREKP